MTAPRAILVHATRRRLRVRVPERKGDPGFFRRVEEGLGEAASVERVITNPRTGSVLIEHDEAAAGVRDDAAARALFVVVDDRLECSTDRVRHQVGELNRRFTRGTRDQQITGLTFYGLLAACGLQIARGKFLPAGEALLLQALKLLPDPPRFGDGVDYSLEHVDSEEATSSDAV